MEIRHFITLPITEKSQAAEARRHAARLTGILGFSKKDASNVAIIVTELAMNLAKHSIGGELFLHELVCETAVGIEVLALDRGPGMANVGQCLTDGYSSSGSPGTGLGAVQRLSSIFDVFSAPVQGTTILARYWSDPNEEHLLSGDFNVGVVSTPKPGETVCGDGWAMKGSGNHANLLLVDGLGHGLLAAEVSRAAIETFKRISVIDPAEILVKIDNALRGSRGAAVAIAEIDQFKQVVRFAGIGNISACILSRGVIKKMVSLHGIVGGEVRKIQEFTYPWPDQGCLLMHSDGLHNWYQFERWPGILYKHPGIIAGRFYQFANRGSDDSTVVVVRPKN